ncbi:MAG TPA: dienelactone hydrolase family protein [Opitutaceae bacterium]
MIQRIPITFSNGGTPLAGTFYRNTTALTERQHAVVITGSWLTVKEQMAHTYAEKMATLGYTAFTFDFTGWGQSGGVLRQTEIPASKIADILAAVEFVNTMSFVKPGAIGYLGICASAQYVLAALARGARLKSFASVAGWFHDTASVSGFYGADEGVARRLERAARATEKFLLHGELETVPAYRKGDDIAGMFFELDYYANPKRGAITAWKNEMSVMTWQHWLTFDGLSAAAAVTTPTLLVHSDGCALPANVKRVHADLRGKKRLVWGDGTQTDYYDQPAFVEKAVAAAHAHFQDTL